MPDPAMPDVADTVAAVPPAAAGALDDARRGGLEALLFLADEPVEVAVLADAVEAAPEVVEAELVRLAASYEQEGRGLAIRAVAGGWRMYTAPATRAAVERWALSGRTGRLTQAALETLAVVAYKQPIGRQEIGDIRGVNADGAVRSLVARGLVAEVGRDPGPGQAALFGTTRLFLERLGIGSLAELPPLTDFLPEAPAPDEPELGALREVRRRLAAGGELGGRSAAETNTGRADESDESDDDGDEVLPAPLRTVGQRADDDEMVSLTDRLESVARAAVAQLRAVVAADAPDPDDASSEAVDVPGEPGGPGGVEAAGDGDEGEDDRG